MSYAVLQVYHVRNKMDKVGLDMLLDIHGDEELPYNFINGNEVRRAPCCSDQSSIRLLLGCQMYPVLMLQAQYAQAHFAGKAGPVCCIVTCLKSAVHEWFLTPDH